ncbi:MAG: hypothetical protein J6M43_01905 [Neisseriaceae bacterium]|nr:hypothetical protein [Neisseriaceae bacterium]
MGNLLPTLFNQFSGSLKNYFVRPFSVGNKLPTLQPPLRWARMPTLPLYHCETRRSLGVAI